MRMGLNKAGERTTTALSKIVTEAARKAVECLRRKDCTSTVGRSIEV